jgi:ribose transport system substrate-binding protein
MRYLKARRRACVGVVAAMASALALAACGSDGGDDKASAGTGASADEPVRIAALLSALTGYEGAVARSVEETAKANNSTVKVFSADYDPAKQLQQCQDVIASGQYDGMIFYPLDGGTLVPCVKEAAEAGVGVVSIDTPIGPDFTSTELQVEGLTGQIIQPITNDAAAVVNMVVDACAEKDPCKVAAVVGEPAFSYSAKRIEYTKQGFEDHPNIELVAELKGGLGTPDTGRSAAQDILNKEPDVDVILNDDDTTMTGIEQAVKEAGLAGKIVLISGGGSKTGWQAVKEGRWYGTVSYLPKTGARKLTEMLIAHARGEKIADNNLALADIHPLGTIELTSENVDQFTPEWDAGDQ